jgi:hypothetical protein
LESIEARLLSPPESAGHPEAGLGAFFVSPPMTDPHTASKWVLHLAARPPDTAGWAQQKKRSTVRRPAAGVASNRNMS